MGEKNLWSKLGLIVVLVGLSVWQINPPQEKLKGGIDLVGGHSLLFEIDDAGLDSYARANLAERMMSILKERVDPQGTRNLVWRPIGSNRLEIQMPKPPPDQKQRRTEFEQARTALGTSNITESQIRNTLRLPPEQRDAAIAEMAAQVPSRKPLFEKLLAANARYQPAEETTTQPAETQPEGETARQMDQAFTDRRQAMEGLMRTNIDLRVLTDLLELGKTDARAKALEKLKSEHPDLAPRIDTVVEKYDVWARDKGVLDDPSDLMRLLRGAGVLEFRILAERSASNPDMTDSSNPRYNESITKYVEQLAKYGPRPRAGDSYRWFKIAKSDDDGFSHPRYIVQEYMGNRYVLAHATPDMGLLADRTWTLQGARQGRDQMGRLTVDFQLDPKGGARFGRLTADNLERPLTIFLDDEAISAASIRSQITTSGQISGTFTPQYVMYLVNTLEAGALPARLKEVPLQEKSVGPSLGATNRTMGFRAVMFSFLATIAFMAIYYSYNGLIADIALLMNLVITLGAMSFLQATFTMPGIAGLILTLGMAVDANVLIYERMREELKRGVSARMAVKLGYEKAFSAILDSNVTTIMTAAILWWIGSEEIKGFGITLGLGLAISMFTALFVTRQFFHIMVPTTLNQQETRRAWLGAGVLALVGGAFMALGYAFNSPAARAESNFIGAGQLFLIMFATAAVLLILLWVFRIVYHATGHQKQNRLPMLRLLSEVNIDWMRKYRIFWAGSAIVIVSGVIFTMGVLERTNILDIEFVGGTSVQLQVKGEATDEEVRVMIAGPRKDGGTDAASWLTFAAGEIEKASVTAAGDSRYLVTTEARLTPAQLQALLQPTIEDYIPRGGINPAGDGVEVQFQGERAEARVTDLASAQALIRSAGGYVRSAAADLRNVRVQEVSEETAGGSTRHAFEVVTTETNRPVVSEAILVALGDRLEVTRPINATLAKDAERAPDGVHPIKQGDTVLADVLGGNAQDNIGRYRGGAAFVFDNLQPPQSAQAIQQRIREMRLQPDFEAVAARDSAVIGLEPAGSEGGEQLYSRVAVVVSDPTLVYAEGENNDTWRAEVAEKELSLVQAALASSRSLQRVTQFAPQVATEAAQRAIIAVILSLIAIAAYLWIRFGSAEFGVAGIIALYHDVAIALTAVAVCHFIHDTWLGSLLLLSDFRIDLNIIAALLTIVGFSINDTIVIFDRIRENRGRMGAVSPTLINAALNQTLSRTILTTLTVLMVVAIMYFAGGEGIHGFAFTLLVGCLSGTYSTLAIATPMLHHPRAMWITTIVIAALTLAGLVFMVDSLWLRIVLVLVVAGGAGYSLYRQFAEIRASERRPEPAAV